MIFSPPFEGGVAGTIDYLIVTSLISRPGWLIYSCLFFFISIKNKNLCNRKAVNLPEHISGPDLQINHPGRKQNVQCYEYHCVAATPPSKGGETFFDLRIYNTNLRLTAMGFTSKKADPYGVSFHDLQSHF